MPSTRSTTPTSGATLHSKAQLMASEHARRHSSLEFLLFCAHTVVELVLGAVKLRGTYSGIDISCAPGASKFARHHGVSLIALALLGAEVLRRNALHTEVGEVASIILAIFHGGTMLVMVHALNLKVVAIHAPFAIGFAAHVYRLRVQRVTDQKSR